MGLMFKNKSYLKRRKKRAEEASTVRKIVAVILSCILVILVAGGISGYLYVKSTLEPVDPESSEQISVEIPLGSSSSEIASALEENGVIRSGVVFRFYTKFRNVAEFQAGEYQLSPSMTYEEVIEELKTGTIIEEAQFHVTIPEGKTIEEIAQLYSLKANVNKQEFLEKAEDKEFIKELMEEYSDILTDEILKEEIRTPLEGYLFAATYEFYEEKPAPEDIIRMMLDKTSEVVASYQSQIEESDLTIHETITMASLIEKEAVSERDRKQIAGVFYNRIEQGMRLQTDPTVLYAHGEHKDRVLFEDLEIESPYNTYYADGLPPGPISNFGESSLMATLEPEDTNYMYFVAAPDGEIYYSVTFDEHKEKSARYLHREAVEAGD